ncbi:Cof-type HAD-IIB family hydrolase [Bombilactobacillus folatiphilus]|uniref:Cof-type HAD-IIB family hydrolase n=1 Tax=Bombilactobacillus folatiphilus TaxID=2923362 RepID=UPI0029500173|nr:Cof-type HAD-IIB family hydrolase [Bombilactobacillus folatiphilus]
MTIKLVLSDIDGTLINAQNELPSKVQQAIINYSQHGTFVLATARPPQATIPFMNQLPQNTLAICLNGSLIIQKRLNSFQAIAKYQLPLTSIQGLLTLLTSHHLNLAVNFFTERHWLVSKRDFWVQNEENLTQTTAQVIPDLDQQLADHTFYKILCMGEPDTINQLSQYLTQAHLPLNFNRSKATYLEIAAQDVSKLKGMEFIMQKLNCTPDQTLAIGDGENDLPMINAAGIGVATANALPTVKAQAQYIVADCDHDGVQEALVRFT